MGKGAPRDVILRLSMNGTFQVLDAATTERLSGSLTFLDALAFAERCGAKTIYQQAVDEHGRVMSEPSPFKRLER